MNIRSAHSRCVLRTAAILTALFFFAAYGYRSLSLSFSADAMLLNETSDTAYQITLGRFLQPVYWRLRGAVTAPMTIALFSCVFLIASAWLVCLLLDLHGTGRIALVCGVLTLNETLALASATYLPWMDVYALALLLNVAGVCLYVHARGGLVWGAVCMALSMGLYPAYLPVAPTLVILLLMKQLAQGEPTARIWRQGLGACAMLVVSLLLYYLALQAVLGVSSLPASGDYNGVGSASLPPLRELPGMLVRTYLSPLIMLFALWGEPAMTWHISTIPAPLNILCIGAGLIALALALRGRRAGAKLTALFLILVLPLSVNFVQFIAKGLSNGLTIYAFNLLWLIPVMLLHIVKGRCAAVVRIGCAALCAIFLLNVRTANQMAVKRDLEFSSTASVMTRLLDRAEAEQGYLPGETPVVIIGYLPASLLAMERPGFETVAAAQGMRYTYAASYETSTYWYLQMAMGERINLVPHEERRALTPAALEAGLTTYPDEGCCRMIDGRLYIRIN
ncbi:MAG: glucosyltransferase domain-containing protein [Clostridia bacterium]|nr:glucosyltransferase domain-containing protein [Clostridia bacterium]